MSLPTSTLLQGHVLDQLATLPDNSVNCVVTSPPYWGLRAYGTEPQIWGGAPMCEHQWLDATVKSGNQPGRDDARLGMSKCARVGRDWDPTAGTSVVGRDTKASTGNFCTVCGAWRGELGLEPTPDLFVDHIVLVFREVRRVLRKDGTCWINIGDTSTTFAGGCRKSGGGKQGEEWTGPVVQPNRMRIPGLKRKDLALIPFRVAIALQMDGWYMRQDIIWEKPSCMPESAKDRPTRSHEYIFLLTKSPRYWYDHEAIKEECSPNTHARAAAQPIGTNCMVPPGAPEHTAGRSEHAPVTGWDKTVGEGGHGSIHRIMLPDNYKGSLPGREGGPGQDRRSKKDRGLGEKYEAADDTVKGTASGRLGRGEGWREKGVNPKAAANTSGAKQNDSFSAAVVGPVLMRNARTVWRFSNPGRKDEHYAGFPDELPNRCIRAGCPLGGTVLDPFGGTGTVGRVAVGLGRNAVLIELNSEYCSIIRRTALATPPLPMEVAS